MYNTVIVLYGIIQQYLACCFISLLEYVTAIKEIMEHVAGVILGYSNKRKATTEPHHEGGTGYTSADTSE